MFNINASPTWSTASGNLGTISDYADATHFTLSATDPEGGSVSYTESTSNLSGAGLALNSSTGAITGNPTDVSSDTTVSFDVNASDGTNTTARSFIKLLAVVFVPSLAFTSNETVVSEDTSVGFPVIAPVDEFNANPAPDKLDVLSV